MTRRDRHQTHGISGLLGVLVMCACPAMAHNSHLLASGNSLPQPGTVRLAFITAEGFPVSEYPTKPHRVDDWIVQSRRGKQPVEGFGIEGDELAATVSLKQPGMYVISASLHPHFIEFPPGHFNGYLEEEGAAKVLALRRSRSREDKPGRMYYTKLTKTFVEVGNQPTQDYDKPVGHTLEIVPLSNPCRWSVGNEAVVRVLYEGKPAVGFRVSSGHGGLSPHTYVENVITDADGVARFKLSRPGLWFLRVHHIRPMNPTTTSRDDAVQADWESFWTSMTFRVRDRRMRP